VILYAFADVHRVAIKHQWGPQFCDVSSQDVDGHANSIAQVAATLLITSSDLSCYD
jgi:hypothetical protein